MSNTASPKIVALTPSPKMRRRLDLMAIALRLLGRDRKIAAGEAESKPLIYDAEDIEEANRIGAAICERHAR